MADFLIDTIEHSWGKSPEQKAREKEYNHWYYVHNKNKWDRYLNYPGGIKDTEFDAQHHGKEGRFPKQMVDNFKNKAKYYREKQKEYEKNGWADLAANAAKEAAEWEKDLKYMKKEDQEGANKRINQAAAYNEMEKARINAEKQVQKYEMLMEGKDPYGSKTSRTVKHLFATAKNTIDEGMEFVKNLFK